MAYELSHKADDDLVEIYAEGVRSWGAVHADRYHAELEQVFQILSDNPELARERSEITPPVRVHPHGSISSYVIDDHGDVLITRVRHSREDWLTNLV